MFVPIEAIPYLRLVKRLFSGRGSLEAIAYRQDILCPEEKVMTSAPVFLPGQIERITDYKATDPWSNTSKDLEISAAVSRTATHAPTIAYHIQNAVLYNGSIYVGHFKHSIADTPLYVPISGEPHQIEPFQIKTAALASSYLGTKYFHHWVVDDCTKYLLAEEMGPLLCVRRPAFSHRLKYQAYFGQDWTPTDRARIEHLIVFQDFSQNSFKAKRYGVLRDRIKTQFPCDVHRLCIYLKRGKTGVQRIIQNEDEIIDSLVKQNFVIIDLASDSLDKIIETLRNAKIVVSMEGGHIAHCVFACPESSGLIVLQPPDRFSAVHRGWSECLRIAFGFVVGCSGDAGYYFSVSEILRTVDLMLDKTEL